MTASLSLCSAVAVPAATVPDWIHLLPAGEIRSRDGRGPYRIGNTGTLIALSMAGGKLVLDENHATDLAAPQGGSAPARGWIVELQSRADGVWGRVEWTGEGKRIMAAGEYRGVSPVIEHSKAGDVIRLHRASLTNTPNFTGLVTLHSASTPADRRAVLDQLRMDVDAVKAQVATLPDLAPQSDAALIGDADRAIIQTLGLDDDAYAVMKAGRLLPKGLDAADVDMIDRLGIDPTAYAATKAGEVG